MNKNFSIPYRPIDGREILYDLIELRDVLGMNKDGIGRLTDSGLLPFLNLDRVMVRLSAITDFLSQMEGKDYNDADGVGDYYKCNIQYRNRRFDLMYKGKLMITPSEAGEILGISDKKVREYIYCGVLPAAYLSGIRLLPSTVKSFKEKTKGMELNRTKLVCETLMEREMKKNK